MRLSDLPALLGVDRSFPDQIVTSVTERIEQVRPGSIFVAVRGRKTDGHQFLERAFSEGAAAAVVASDSIYATHARCAAVPDTREALALLCRAFFGQPQKKLKLIAVTGTCGKSTVTHMLHSFFRAHGVMSGLIGTVFCDDGREVLPSEGTTPCPENLWPLLARMAKNNCKYCFMEASSQAIDQRRLAGLSPEIGVFTNFSQDHLDVHGSLQAYFEAKCKLLYQSRFCIIGTDSPILSQLYEQFPGKTCSFGQNSRADFSASDLICSENGVSFQLHEGCKTVPFFVPMIGSFSVENALAFVSAARQLSVSLEDAAAFLADYQPLCGRMEWVVRRQDMRVMIDFAHTPASLQAALEALKPICSGRLILVFGCGGDRDRDKRPKMARAATIADVIFLTDDNPRSEDPRQILQDLLPTLQASGKPFFVLQPREAAIEQALTLSRPGDILLLAGKGHEKQQWIGNSAEPMDEKALVRAYCKRHQITI